MVERHSESGQQPDKPRTTIAPTAVKTGGEVASGRQLHATQLEATQATVGDRTATVFSVPTASPNTISHNTREAVETVPGEPASRKTKKVKQLARRSVQYVQTTTAVIREAKQKIMAPKDRFIEKMNERFPKATPRARTVLSHASWYGLSIGSGALYTHALGNANAVNDLTVGFSAAAYAAMDIALFAFGQRTIREQVVEGHSHSAYAQLGYDLGRQRLKKDFLYGRKKEPIMTPQQADNMVDQVVRGMKEKIGSRKELKAKDTKQAVTAIVGQALDEKEITRRENRLMRRMKYLHASLQAVEESPYFAYAAATGLTHRPKELAIFLGWTALSTVAVRGALFYKLHKYSGEPVWFPRTQKALRNGYEAARSKVTSKAIAAEQVVFNAAQAKPELTGTPEIVE